MPVPVAFLSMAWPLACVLAAPQPDLEVRREFATIRAALQEFHTDPASRQRWQRVAPEVFEPESLILPADRDPADVVLRRTEALLRHLHTMADAPDLSVEEMELRQLKEENGQIAISRAEQRYALFERAVRLRRRIAFSNPLLNFDRILFIKRHFLRPEMTRGNHMCDQYFGFFAIPGGGLYILEGAFSDHPRVRDVLADSVCINGRFKGRRLAGGAFLSPDLSYDARQIVFAYTQAEPTPFRWTPNSTFHIFKVNADGSALVQLTDGAVNDFDPCWLPDGRIVFISERRGGYGRCHPRPVPLYTLHAMNTDGTGIVRLSYHESNEWHPSVDRDGMIVYTRWDYVDRGNIQAHHPWTTRPDGTDPRAIQGNFRASKSACPTMEVDVRAIPGSHKYVATAAAHHGQAYGSLVLIDPRLEDDDAMAAVRRLTPDAPFPEAEVGWNEGQLYATAWPLSERFYLCVYDPRGSGRRGPRNNYGIYVVDAFGNRELLYRDPSVSCLSPIPLRPRKPEPVLAGTLQDLHRDTGGSGLVGVVNVYDSLLPFPEGTVITALRVIQVLPKTTPLINEPRIGYGNEKGARAVLGTVPVEADGSAYFRLPAGKLVYFQALDERGLAVQSMRSGTYVHAGERLLCRGCHEPRHVSPGLRKGLVAAFRRPPSVVKPDVDGSNPFSFPRLVQPVLDRNCVDCHEREPTAPDLGRGDWAKAENLWYASYVSLRPFAFFYGAVRNKYDPWTEPRTSPGRFGARASRLLALLEAGHYGVELSDEDLHRLTLWLDCNSDFFGAYEDTEAQARAQVVRPALE